MAPRLRTRLVLGVFTAYFGSAGCGAKPAADNGCKLSCKNPVIGASTFTITPISAGTTFTCNVAKAASAADVAFTDAPQPFKLEFTITGDDSKNVPDYTVGSSGQISPTFGAVSVPRANVAFVPIVQGALSGSHTNAENGTYNKTTGEVVPYDVAGIVTPRSEWCTDSCGVATVVVWPLCPPSTAANPVGVYIRSGTAYSATVNSSVSTTTYDPNAGSGTGGSPLTPDPPFTLEKEASAGPRSTTRMR